MRAYVDRFWNQALAAFKAAAEPEEADNGTGRGAVVRRGGVVEASQELAFDVFTTGFDDGGRARATHRRGGREEVVIEPSPARRWFERAVDGNESTGAACSTGSRRAGSGSRGS